MNLLHVRTAIVASLLLLFASQQSVTRPGSVLWIWSGAVTASSAVVKARLNHDAERVRLALSEAADLRKPRFAGQASAGRERNGRVVSLAVSGLAPDTRYFYALEVDGRIDRAARGSFRTFPGGPASFRFAFGSCAQTGSKHPIFLAIRDEKPLFFVNLGDFHYENIDDGVPSAFQEAYDAVLTSLTQSALYREVPVVYVWDDHDFGGSDSDRTSASREAARLQYQRNVPHYPLAAGSGDVPIYQSFQAGRVYFLLTDGRSERSPSGDPDDGAKTVLGAAQKQWLKQELLRASRRFALVVWLQASPWIGQEPDDDLWSSYATERRELASFVAAHRIDNLLMLSGDAHMVAIDDGRNNRYAADGRFGFPVFHAAPLDKGPRLKGGPYSEGVSRIRGQYGLVEILDDGASIRVRLVGKTATGERVMSYAFSPSASRAPLMAGPGGKPAARTEGVRWR